MSDFLVALAAIKTRLEETITNHYFKGAADTTALPAYELEMLHDINAVLGSGASGASPASDTTAANQALQIAELQSILASLNLLVSGDAGDATAPNQLANIAELQAANTQLDIPLSQLETAIANGGGSDATAANQVLQTTSINELISNFGDLTNPAATNDISNWNFLQLLKRINAVKLDASLSDVIAAINASSGGGSSAGSATSANQLSAIQNQLNIINRLDQIEDEVTNTKRLEYITVLSSVGNVLVIPAEGYSTFNFQYRVNLGGFVNGQPESITVILEHTLDDNNGTITYIPVLDESGVPMSFNYSNVDLYDGFTIRNFPTRAFRFRVTQSYSTPQFSTIRVMMSR